MDTKKSSSHYHLNSTILKNTLNFLKKIILFFIYIVSTSTPSYGTPIDIETIFQRATSLKEIKPESMILILDDLINSLKNNDLKILLYKQTIQHLNSFFETNKTNHHQFLIAGIHKNRPLNFDEQSQMIFISIHNLFNCFLTILDQYSKEQQEDCYNNLKNLSDGIKSLLLLLLKEETH